ncbi:MAG: hypothetical protein AB7O97_19235 [Planctomycetota bacterium]
MKWLLCGLTFALAVGLAVATAAIRAGNIRLRQQLERDYRRIEARAIELRRLQVLAIDQVTPERLAGELRALLRPAAGQDASAAAAAATGGQEAVSWQ